ncbi:hypothetical protein WMY93_023353 [Mugilogobius chulae]|uniref:Aminotransferase class I/classII large domain-containing protein n=1 Tax=Mugilogobius chulae TaxID=88201 RepID=A0AAW0NF36_9GOBI
MYYGSGDDQETDVQSVAGPEEAAGQEERPVTPAISPSGISEVNTSCSATGSQAGSESQERHFTEAPYYTLSNVKPKKRKGTRHNKTSSAGTFTGLDRALVNFLKWQQVTEERLLSLEEARLEREIQAEERRQQREEQRAEQERQHELRLFSMLTKTLGGGKRAAPFSSTDDPGMSAESCTPHISSQMASNRKKTHTKVKPCRKSKELVNREHSAYLSNRGTVSDSTRVFFKRDFYSMERTNFTKLIIPILREEVARFLTDYCCSPRALKADNVVVMNGCGSIFSCVATVICDAKDAILIPTPFYGVIRENLTCMLTLNYSMCLWTVRKMKRAKQEGITIRGIILMNPHNPLAEIYTQTEMIAFLEFAKRNELHVIVDEVYMLTVFDESAVFSSVLNLESLPDPERTHVMWSMSKDFAMAGIRIGTLYSENRALIEALAQLGSFHGIPGPAQHQAAQLLQDREWINNEFLPENRSRLKEISEGAFSCSTPGWFRIVFADQQHHLELGLKRFKDALKEIEETHACPSSSSGSIQRPIERQRKSAKEENSDSNNSVFVNSMPSPRSKSPDALRENGTLLANDRLDTLIGTLRHQMKSSDWLQKNTPELTAGEDPEILDGFMALLQRARK